MLKTVSSVINAIGALNYQGTWNAATNTPTLTSSVGTKGDYYVVSVAGSTNLDGTTLWGVGDWAVFNGSIWQKVDGGSTGDFTNVSISGTLTLSGGTANAVTYLNTSKVVTTGTALQFNGATLGVGVTPQTWWATRKALQVGDLAALASDSSTVAFTANIYNDAGGTATYLTTAAASAYYQTGGQHLWYSAASGTAGDPISLTQRMGLDASGNLTLNAGTANGVAYLNGSKVLTTGSALTFDGTSFKLSAFNPTIDVQGSASSGSFVRLAGNANTLGTNSFDLIQGSDSSGYVYNRANAPVIFGVNNAEQMRLTSTGLGIGTSSPAYKLEVSGTVKGNSWTGIDATSSLVSYFGVYDANTTQINSYTGTTPKSIVFRGYTTEYMRLDTSGNLGLGVTPSAWGSGYKAIQLSAGATIFGSPSAYDWVVVGANYYDDGTNVKYIGSTYATQYRQYQGKHIWFNAPSGTAGSAITFTQAMTLDASGNLALGTTAATFTAGYAGQHIHNSATSSGVQLHLTNAGTGATSADGSTLSVDANAILYLWNNEAAATVFATNNTERARIDSSGNLLVGTTTALSSVSGSYQVKVGEAGMQTTSQAIAASTATTIARSGSGGVAIVSGYNGTGQYSAIVLFKYGGTTTNVIGVLNDTGSTITYAISGVNLQVTSSLALTNLTVICLRSS